jgi:HEAT repeat protein
VTDVEPSADALVRLLHSADFNARALALAELVRRGHAAVAALQGALDVADQEVRVEAMRGLAEIAHPSSADIFARFLDAPDERLRAFAARGLARIGDPRARDALVRTIDDYPDVLHHPFTAAVLELIALGPAGLPAVAPLLSAPGAITRERAFLVIRGIVEANPGLGSWETLAARLGVYDPNALPTEREAAAQRWREWIGQGQVVRPQRTRRP